METSIFTWFGYPVEMDKRLAMIKNAGFDSVVLWWDDDNLSADIKRNEQPKLTLKHGLKIENVHLPFERINTLWEDSINGDEYERYLIKSIKECSDFGIKTAVLHLLRGWTALPKTTVGLDRFKRIVESAEKYNVNIAFENLVIEGYLNFILKNISSPNIGICYDSGHNNCFTPNRNVLREFNDKIIAIHLHDNDGVSDLHMLPFDGVIDWKAVKSDLINSLYKGPLTLEVEMGRHEMYKNMSAEEFLSTAHQRLIDFDLL